jgi:hemolysin D
VIDRQVAQKRAERATIEASIEELEAIIPPLQERVEIRRHLFNKELGSKLLYLTELQGAGADAAASMSRHPDRRPA